LGGIVAEDEVVQPAAAGAGTAKIDATAVLTKLVDALVLYHHVMKSEARAIIGEALREL